MEANDSRRVNVYLDGEANRLLDLLVNELRHKEGGASRSYVVRRALREMAEREGVR